MFSRGFAVCRIRKCRYRFSNRRVSCIVYSIYWWCFSTCSIKLEISETITTILIDVFLGVITTILFDIPLRRCHIIPIFLNFYFPSVSKRRIVIECVGRLSTFAFSQPFMTPRGRRNRSPVFVCLSVLPSRIFIRQIISESTGPIVVKFCIYIRNIM